MSSLSLTSQLIQDKLDLFLQGDQAAKKELVNIAYEKLLLLSRKLLGGFDRSKLEDETAGIVHESWLRLDKAIDEVKPATIGQFFGLASLQMTRVLLDKIRKFEGRGKAKKRKSTSMNQSDDELALPDRQNNARQTEIALDVLEGISALADPEREAVELIFFHSLTQAEAASIVGVHEDTIKRRWMAAKVALATQLKALSEFSS